MSELLCDDDELNQISHGANGLSVTDEDNLESVSPADLWDDLKDTENLRSDAMDSLVKMTGLRRVKQTAVQLFKQGLNFANMDPETRRLNAPSLNYVFMGNPGTGKTTVARYFAEILRDSGLRLKGNFEETSGQDLKEAGVDEFKKKTKAAMDGVLFIDECYTLDPVGDKFKGAPVANELLTSAENERERLTFILAGYEDEIQDKLYAFNPGFKSRFTEVYFDDFDEDELLTVWNGLREERRWREADDCIGRVVIRRIAKLKGRKGFGNARLVRQKWEEAVGRATLREDFDSQNLELRIEDAVGENPVRNKKLQAVVAEFEGKTGWAMVKKQVKALVEVCSQNYERELKGQEQLPVQLNRLFLGNPGTGKTTSARLYGRLLKELGFLSNGEVVEKTAGDLGGQVVGEAKQKTVALIESCRGKVLMIDEAYGLNDSLYGKQALDALVEKVQGTEADDIAVLLLGYEEQMTEMLDNQNPGLRRRFAAEQAFRFEDYNSSQLEKILLSSCKAKNYKPTLEFRERALKKLEMQRQSESHFGNAGSVQNLLKESVSQATSKRKCSSDGSLKLDAQDIELPGDGEVDMDVFAELDKLYRMETVREELQKIKSQYDLADEEGEERPKLGHFIFTGAPGTGKTTVARCFGKMLHRCGLIARPDVLETSGLKLTGEYIGQTKKVVEEQLEKAKGGILFIDEAYELGKTTFGSGSASAFASEAVSALVEAMTNDDRYGGLVIIMAGYQSDMQSMLDTNQGLKSRFNRFLEFPDWHPADCSKHFLDKANANKFSIEEEEASIAIVEKGFKKMLPLKGWGNARDVTKFYEKVLENRSQRLADERARGGSISLDKILLKEDIESAMDTMISARMGTGGAPRKPSEGTDPFAELDKLYRMETVKQKLQQLQNTYKVAAQDGEDPPPLGHFIFTGSPGTGKTTVARAMSDILFDLELTSRKHVEETSGLKLQGQYLGQTAPVVEKALDKAKGGVLFIDEAYTLGQGQFGSEACDTLVAAMTDPQYAGVVVIIAGYQSDINEMLQSNSGLKSRFTHTLEFPDWDVDDCVNCFVARAVAKGFEIADSGVDLLQQGFKKLRPLDGFGNARDVDAAWKASMRFRADRVAGNALGKRLLKEDIKSAMDSLVSARMGTGGAPRKPSESTDPFVELDKLYRMETIKRKLQQLQNTYKVATQDGEDPPPLGHFIFTGSPGTGKTTVARVMSDILFDLELTTRKHVEETSGLNLQGQYLGQTAKVVEKALDKAKGGVLFIDEAYTLGQGRFGSEACDTLVAAMTSPKYAGVVVVIAGYPRDIDNMLRSNSGLKSRFTHTLEFPDWDVDDCVNCFVARAEAKGFEIADNGVDLLQQGFKKLKPLDGFGNARDVDAVWRASMRFRADRVAGNAAGKRFEETDLQQAFGEMVKGRSIADGKQLLTRKTEHDQLFQPPACMEQDDPKEEVKDLPTKGQSAEEMKEAMAKEALEASEEHAHLLEPPTCVEQENLKEKVEDAPIKMQTDEAVKEVVEEESLELDFELVEEEEFRSDEGRDPGVSDEVWAQLQMAKQAEEKYMEQCLAEEEERKRVEAEIEAQLRAKQLAIEEYERKMRELERQRELEAKAAEEAEMKRVQAEIEAKLRAERLAKEAHEQKMRELERQRELEAEKKRQKEKIQQKLRAIGNCPMGFKWHQCGSGWRCSAGGHFVSDSQLNKSFGYDI